MSGFLLLPCPWLFRVCSLALITAVFFIPTTVAQQHDTPETVALRITLELPEARGNRPLRHTEISVQPLDNQAEPQRVRVSEGVATILNLLPGRYEITSTEPVDVEGQPYGWDVEVPLMYHTNELRLSQENAVRVSDEEPGSEQPVTLAANEPASNEPADPPRAPPLGSVTPAPPNTTVAQSLLAPEVRAQIEDLLDRWTSALRDHDLSKEMTCYAPHLTAYFRQRDVSKDFVRRDKERFLQRYPEVRQLGLSDVQIFAAGDHPEVRALKTWSFGGHKDWTGQVVTHLQLTNENGRWVIVSERERLVHENVPFSRASASATAQ